MLETFSSVTVEEKKVFLCLVKCSVWYLAVVKMLNILDHRSHR